MSPEWMMAFDIAAMRNDKRGKTLVDPLERAEWQGLDLVSRLFSRWLSTDGRGKPAVSPDAALQARTLPSMNSMGASDKLA